VIDAILFWLLVVALGVAALPFAELLFDRLPGRGLVFALPLGLLVAAFPPWLLASLHLVPYGRATALGSIAVYAAVAVFLWWRRGLGRLGRQAPGWSLWLAGEILFTVAFFAWSLLRSFEPAVWQTEKPMDMALVNVVNKSDWFPPHDPWQSGTDVNYYYYGHYLVAFLVRVTGIDPAVAFNLAVALFYALVTVSVFGVAAVLYEAARREGDAPRRSPVLVGLTAAFLATMIGNLAGGFQWIHHTSRISSYDWWAPSRVIDGTANEFPYFSFLLADLHAHVMVTPFALVAVAYAVQLGVHGPPAWGRNAWLRPAAELLLAGLVLGGLYAINSFDFPTACLIGVGALLVWSLEEPGRWRRALVWGAGWLAVALLLFLPFWHSFSPPTHSIGRIRDHVGFATFARDYLLIYGVSLWVVLALFAGRFQVPRKYLAWAGAAMLFVLVLLAPPRLAGVALALLIVALAAFVTLASGRISQPYRMLWLLTAVALALVASGEVVYLRDAFDGTASFRFNTVFKTGYQAWFLLAIVAGVVVYWSANWLGRRLRIAWLAVLAGLVALALVYPVFASYSRSLRFTQSPTLDGMLWLERSAPDDAAAIEWMRSSVPGSSTILEQVGKDFDPEGRGRVSTYTGLPTVMAWPGHEVQWGHDPGSRAADVQQIYSTTDMTTARQLLDEYGVRYVFVGSLERKDYKAAALAKFARLGTPAFRAGDTVVYRLQA
jgi:YYY domain-containing protein